MYVKNFLYDTVIIAMKYEHYPEPRVNLQQLCLDGLENVLQKTRLHIVQDDFAGNDTNLLYPDFRKPEPPQLAA